MVTLRLFLWRKNRRRGGVTVEMAAVASILLVPVLLALGELARLDRSARQLQFGMQRPVIEAAMAGNADPSFRLIAVERRVPVAMRANVRDLLEGRPAAVTLRRCYWIATGSGAGMAGD